MKKTIYILLFLVSFFGYSQEAKLKSQFGADAILAGVGVFYEQPITKYVLADVSGGYGSTFIRGLGVSLISLDTYRPYTRVGLKVYYNRKSRAEKGKNINHNIGNFIGIQNKMMYGEKSYFITYMINEVYWGAQNELAKNLLYTFQAGIGYYSTDDSAFNSGFFPTVGLRIKYILF